MWKRIQSAMESLKDEKLGWQDVIAGITLAGIILGVLGGAIEWSLGIVLDYLIQSPIKFALLFLTNALFFSTIFTYSLAKKLSKSHFVVLLSTLAYSGLSVWLWADVLPDKPSVMPVEDIAVIQAFTCPALQAYSREFETLPIITRDNATKIKSYPEPIPIPQAIVTSFSKDNQRLVLTTGQTLCIYTLNQPVPIVHVFRRAITATSFSHDSHMLTVGLEDGTVGVLEIVDTNIRMLWLRNEEHTNPIVGLKFSANDQWLVSTSTDGVIKAWEALRTERQFDVGKMAQGTSTISFIDNSHLVSSDTGGNLYWWELQFSNGHSEERQLKLHNTAITAIAVFDRFLATGDHEGTIRVWNTSSLWNQPEPGKPEPLIQLMQHTDTINSLAFNPDGSLLASGSKDNSIIVWDISNGASLVTLPQLSSVYTLAFGLNGKLLASSNADGMVYLWGVISPTE